jgi:hypothetical protein
MEGAQGYNGYEPGAPGSAAKPYCCATAPSFFARHFGPGPRM